MCFSFSFSLNYRFRCKRQQTLRKTSQTHISSLFWSDQLDVLAARLHKHHKCVIFVCDKHILKAGEIRGCIDFVGYKFLSKANESIKVYDDIEVAEDGASESLMEFIVRRRGLYMCGDDPTKLLKRYNFFIEEYFRKILIKTIFILQYACSPFGYRSERIWNDGHPGTETLKIHTKSKQHSDIVF